jgi:hypothetical protein
MAQQMIEASLGSTTGVERAVINVSVPAGAILRGLLLREGEAWAVFQGDPAQPTSTRSLGVVRAGVDLNAAELGGQYVGSYLGLRPSIQGNERWHVFAL